MSTDKARIAELNVLLDKAERENTRLAKELAREIDAGCVRDAENTRLRGVVESMDVVVRDFEATAADCAAKQRTKAGTVRANLQGMASAYRRAAETLKRHAQSHLAGTDNTAIRQPAPDVQTALVDALEGLLAHLGPGGYIPHAGKPATDRARAALKLAGRGTP